LIISAISDYEIDANKQQSVIFYNCYILDYREGIKMPTIMPEGEDVQKAIKWISANIEENENLSILKLVEKAVFKFDISPKDAEFLSGFFRNRKAGK
jgi:hypothetical protein